MERESLTLHILINNNITVCKIYVQYNNTNVQCMRWRRRLSSFSNICEKPRYSSRIWKIMNLCVCTVVEDIRYKPKVPHFLQFISQHCDISLPSRLFTKLFCLQNSHIYSPKWPVCSQSSGDLRVDGHGVEGVLQRHPLHLVLLPPRLLAQDLLLKLHTVPVHALRV